MIKILLVSHVSVSHGAGGSLLQLASALKQRGHTPLVVVPESGTLSAALAQRDVQTAQVKCLWWVVDPTASLKARQWHVRHILLASYRLVRLIRRFEPDLVHTNSAVIPSGALAAYVTGVPHIWHLREHVTEDFGLHFVLGRRISLYLVGRLSRALIAISKSVARTYTTRGTMERMHVVYNGVDLDVDQTVQYANRDPCRANGRRSILALVGALHPAKGQDQAVRALAELQRRGIPCQLKLIGADVVGYRDRLQALAEELGVAEHVWFAGHLSNPFVEMARADVALMCSRCEGFGRATVEAMLLERPIVAANTCGTLELIEDGRSGLFYRSGDPVHLAERIANLLGYPVWARQLGTTARQVALKRFSVAQYVDGVESVYNGVLAGQ